MFSIFCNIMQYIQIIQFINIIELRLLYNQKFCFDTYVIRTCMHDSYARVRTRPKLKGYVKRAKIVIAYLVSYQ